MRLYLHRVGVGAFMHYRQRDPNSERKTSKGNFKAKLERVIQKGKGKWERDKETKVKRNRELERKLKREMEKGKGSWKGNWQWNWKRK